MASLGVRMQCANRVVCFIHPLGTITQVPRWYPEVLLAHQLLMVDHTSPNTVYIHCLLMQE